MKRLAIESGKVPDTGPVELPAVTVDPWVEERQAGLRELDARSAYGLELMLFWKQAGNLVILGATTDSGEKVVTLVPGEQARDSLDHPASYFSHEASDRLFGQAA